MSSLKTPKGSIHCYDKAIREEQDIVITTLNGLPRSWDSFIQGICAKRKLITFNRIWEECTQEEARLIIREKKMEAIEDQSLMIQRKSFNQRAI